VSDWELNGTLHIFDQSEFIKPQNYAKDYDMSDFNNRYFAGPGAPKSIDFSVEQLNEFNSMDKDAMVYIPDACKSGGC
jgi:hypothetical protein